MSVTVDSPASVGPAPGARRIALLLPSLDAGGVARSLLELAEGFAKAGHAVDLLPCRARGAHAGRIPAGVRLVELQPAGTLVSRLRLLRLDPAGWQALARPALLAFKPSFTQRYFKDLVRYLRASRPAALLAANTPANLLAVWARQQAGVPTRIVISEHTQLSLQAGRSRRWRWRHVGPLAARVYPRADAIVAVSDGVADDLADLAGLPRNAIRTLYNPVVSPELLQRARQSSPHPWLADGAAPVVVAAGRLKPQKNFPLLLRAFARLRQQRPARLLILGEGKQRQELETLARELRIADDVAMPGYAPNPYAAFSRAALFVLSSDWEGLPTVLIEALACGCPVVATDCPSGPAEILAGGRYGELVPMGDVERLAAAMARTLDHPLAAEILRARGAEFGLERSVARYLELLLPATGALAHA
jgi:glycosyltransferase involved in cell wall biosynthesis